MAHNEVPVLTGRHPQPSPESASAVRLGDSSSVIVKSSPSEDMDPAQFLLELAGQGRTAEGLPGHLVMSDDARGNKYTTAHEHLSIADCRAHLAGTRTVGGPLTREALCRLAGYDANTAAAYAILERTAFRILTAGARPILEQAPLPDDHPHVGGKLWLAFDARVCPARVFGTAEQYAPELRQIRERFPGPTMVRLPGGRYRHGVNVWSELQAVGADDSTWYTGYLAIQTIMENLTPAAWVEPIESCRPAASSPTRDHTLPATIYEGAGRNRWLTRIAGSDRNWGMAGDLILARLHPLNERHCRPPLDDAELARIAYGMERYPAGVAGLIREPVRTRWVSHRG